MVPNVDPPSVSLLPHPKPNEGRRRAPDDGKSEAFRRAVDARGGLSFDSTPPVAVAAETEAAMADLDHVDGAALPSVVRLYNDAGSSAGDGVDLVITPVAI